MEAIETWKGNSRKIKTNLRSTKKNIKEEEEKTNELAAALEKMNVCYHAVYNLSKEMEQKMYTGQTGRFPVQYVMILCEVKSNAILVEPLRNKTSGEMVAAYQKLVNRLREGGIEPNLHILDNEILGEYRDAIAANQMKFQLVPPHGHRRNIAEKLYRYLKIISYPCYVELTHLSLCVSGAKSYANQNIS